MRWLFVALLMFGLTIGCPASIFGQEKPPLESVDLTELSTPPSEMQRIIEWYEADLGSLNRFHNIPVSPQRQQRMEKFYRKWLDVLPRLDFAKMSADGKLDYILFENHVKRELRQLEIDGERYEEMKTLLPFAETIVALEEARRNKKFCKGRKAAEELTKIREQINALQKKLGKKSDSLADKPIHPMVANRAALTVDRLRRTLFSWYRFYKGYDPNFTWWAEEPFKSTDAALNKYGDFLRAKLVGVDPDDPTTIVGDPLGKEALESELGFEMIPYSPEELLEIAEAEMRWCHKEWLKSAKDLGYGDDWRKALEHVKRKHVEPGEQPEMIRMLADEAVAFLKKHNLVTVPEMARKTWRMEMMTPERQLVNPYFTGGEIISVSFPTNTMTHEQKMMSMRGNNLHFSRATVHHELMPGHHLQMFMTSRYRPYRQTFRTPFWLEGWALYWEMLLYDRDFAKSPEDRVGMLFWRKHRCARIIFTLNFHLGKMTPQQCIDYLVENVGHERNNATAEVRRSFNGSYPPLYQAAYMLGGLQIRQLRRELVDSGKMTDREFHDTILKHNSIPIAMLRARLTGQALSREFRPEWRFYPLKNQGGDTK